MSQILAVISYHHFRVNTRYCQLQPVKGYGQLNDSNSRVQYYTTKAIYFSICQYFLIIHILQGLRCYCEYDFETRPTKKIMCGMDGNFTLNSFCESNEICNGASSISDAVMEPIKKSLCANGKFKYQLNIF